MHRQDEADRFRGDPLAPGGHDRAGEGGRPDHPSWLQRNFRWLTLGVGGAAFLGISGIAVWQISARRTAERILAAETQSEFLETPDSVINVQGFAMREGNLVRADLDEDNIKIDRCGQRHPARVKTGTATDIGQGVLQAPATIEVDAHGQILVYELEGFISGSDHSRNWQGMARLRPSPN